MGKRTKKRIEKLYNEIVFERRILMGCTVLIGLSIAVWCISITTDYWFIVNGGDGIYIPTTKRYFYTSHSGLWRICRFAFANETSGVSAGFSSGDTQNVTGKSETKGKMTYFKKCKFHEMSYPDVKTKRDPSYDRTIVNIKNSTNPVQPVHENLHVNISPEIPVYQSAPNYGPPVKSFWLETANGSDELDKKQERAGKKKDKTLVFDYNRTEAIFAIIALALMIIGFIFSCYTFNNTRYMFKRTAGGIHFLSTGSTLTVIEVVINSIEYERTNIPFTYPPGATHKYGYSFVLAWLVFISNLLSGCAFMIFSRKRKGDKAPNEEIAMADGVTIIGR